MSGQAAMSFDVSADVSVGRFSSDGSPIARDEQGRLLVWRDVPTPPVAQRLYAIDTDGTEIPLDRWRCRV